MRSTRECKVSFRIQLFNLVSPANQKTILPVRYTSRRPGDWMNDTVRKALLLVLCFAVLSGCGFKGPLELPPPNPEESEPENAPASSKRHSSN